MSGPVRLRSNRGSNISLEALAPAVADLENAVDSLQTQMTTMTGTNSIGAPAPTIPFKIAERSDNDGIYVTVGVTVPTNATVLRIQIIRKVENQKQASDADDVAAVKRANRRLLKFDLEISEKEAADGLVEREIGPLKEKKSSTDMAYQLIRLIVTNDAGGKSKNPTMSPLNPAGALTVGQQIFPALVVASGGVTEFTVGNAVSSPPKIPIIADIICNQVATEGSVSTAKVTVRLTAVQDGSKKFSEVGATDAYIVFKLVGDTATETVAGQTGEVDNRLKFGGPLENTDVNFVLIDAILTFGASYEYKKAITTNASGKQVSVATGQTFIAGKGLPVTLLTATSLTASKRDAHHTLLTLKFTQPSGGSECNNPAAYIKRIEYYVQEDNDASFVLEKKVTGLDEESYAIAGQAITLQTKVKHKANQTAIAYRAKIIGVGKNPSFINVDSNANTSTFSTLPATPQATDIISNLPDDDTDGGDAIVVFAVPASTDRSSTYRDVGADGAYVVLRRKKSAASTSTGDDTVTDNSLTRYGGPLDTSDLDTVASLVTVRGLKLGRRYLWVRNITTSQGTPAKSGKGDVPFIAGFGVLTDDSQDIQRLTFTAPIAVTRINKHHSKISLTFTQPAGVPVQLKNAKVFQKLVNNSEGAADNNFIVKDKEVLKETPEYSSNTALQGDNTDTFTKRIDFTVQHPVNTAGIQYYVEIRAIGNDAEYIGNNSTHVFASLTPFTDGNTGGNLTGMGPSPPRSGAISSTITGTDRNDGKAILNVIADWNGSVSTGKTFAQVGADECIAVLRRGTDTGDTLKFGGTLTAEQLLLSAVDIECPGLRVGKQYVWTKNIIKSVEGVRQTATPGSQVDFIAGNYSNDPNLLTNLAVALTPEDARHSLVKFTFTQPNPPVFIRKLRLLETQSAVVGDAAKVVDRIDAENDLSSDGSSYNSAGNKEGIFVIKHKRPPNTLTLTGQILLVASDTPKSVTAAPIAIGDTDDIGIPFYNGSNQNTPDQTAFAFIKLRWKPAHLRAHIKLPTNNMTSFDRVKVRYQIKGLSGGSNYIWNPDDGSNFANGSADPLDSLSVYGDDTYTLDLGKTGHAQTNADRPDPNSPSGKGSEFPSGAYQNLVANTSFVEITFFIYNGISTPGSSFCFVKGKLVYTPSDPLIWVQQ